LAKLADLRIRATFHEKTYMKATRREFLNKTFHVAVAGAVAIPFACAKSNASVITATSPQNPLQLSQIKLPYSYNALEPSIDAQTMEIHYSKHHAAYVKNVNDALVAEKSSATSEVELLKNISKASAKIRNNAGGVYNHNFFWEVMKPQQTSSQPSGKISEALNGSFGSFDKFKEQFTQAALTRFGSGWAWLIKDQGGVLKIGSTPNQDNPLMDISELKGEPLLALDVWEHAYYLKYQNKRNEYVANWWNVVNWDAVASRLG
jgi:superoxide dismutase, Fe-Mn family